MELTELRELFLQAEEARATRVLAVTLSVLLLLLVLRLVRRRELREEYTPLWVAVSLVVLVVGLRLDLLRGLTELIGAWTMSSTLYFLGLVFLVCFSLHASVRLSKQGVQIKNLVQETALLRARLDERDGPPPAARKD